MIRNDFIKTRRRYRTPIVATAIGLCVLAGLALAVTKTPESWPSQLGIQTSTPQPYKSRLESWQLYADPLNYAAKEQAQITDPSKKATLSKISQQPIAEWFGDWNTNVAADVDRYVTAATEARQLPVIVTYNIPNRDCGSFSAGGTTSESAYREWVRAVSSGIAGRAAVVIVEPDATSQLTCLNAVQKKSRFALLNESIVELKKLPQTSVYLDAGNAGWIDAATMSKALIESGVFKADGVSVNVANYYSNDESHAYAQRLLGQLKHTPALGYVIDTSRNGNGTTGISQWCNPAGRLLGRAPEITSDRSGHDGYLWIKKPGASDGTCGGGPAAGQWWLDRALELAR